jgi:thioredoxin reductase (NADPH)
VILATGVEVTAPAIEGHAEAVSKGLIRYCPICDGFECAGKRVAVLGARAGSLEEALFLRPYASEVTLLSLKPLSLSAEQVVAARDNGVRIEARPVVRLAVDEDRIAAAFAAGDVEQFDVLYPCLGSRPRSALAAALGAEVTPSGGLLVDSRQQTRLPMFYAAGDVLEGLDQIASACGQAAIAATAINNHLRQG